MNHFSKFSVFKQMPCLIRSFASQSYLQGGGSKEIVRLSGGINVYKNMSVIHRTFADKSCPKGGGDKSGEEGDKKDKCSSGSSGSKPPKSCSSGQPKAKPKPKENKSCRRGPGEAHFQAAKWRKISLFSVLPAIFAFTIFTFATMHKHERAEFIPYEYMRKRDKKFCWGDGNHTFFHNKHVNALPEGYEDE